jgi:hypothetical protein
VRARDGNGGTRPGVCGLGVSGDCCLWGRGGFERGRATDYAAVKEIDGGCVGGKEACDGAGRAGGDGV